MMARCILAMVFLTASVMPAQTFEVGASGGFGFSRHATVTSPAGEGKAGLKNGVAAGAWFGDDMHPRVSGELHYLYRMSDFQVEGGGQKAGFNGESHLVHFDFLLHSAPRDQRIRLFVAGGAGVRQFRGTGQEHAFQPANRFAWLTRTNEIKGVISVGAGVKAAMGRRALLRLEVRDYISPFPKDVITPAAGAAIKGWMHDFVPTVGISYLF